MVGKDLHVKIIPRCCWRDDELIRRMSVQVGILVTGMLRLAHRCVKTQGSAKFRVPICLLPVNCEEDHYRLDSNLSFSTDQKM